MPDDGYPTPSPLGRANANARPTVVRRWPGIRLSASFPLVSFRITVPVSHRQQQRFRPLPPAYLRRTRHMAGKPLLTGQRHA
jgi:hypothetical protein